MVSNKTFGIGILLSIKLQFLTSQGKTAFSVPAKTFSDINFFKVT